MKKPSSGYRRRLVMDAKDTSVEAVDNDAVGRVEQLPHRRAERQERGEVVPGVLPDPRGLGDFFPQGDSVKAARASKAASAVGAV